VATAALSPAKHAPPGYVAVPADLNTESRMLAFEKYLDMRSRGVMTSILVAAPHIDTIADENGVLIKGTDFDKVCRISQGRNELLKVVILVDGTNGKDAENARNVLKQLSLTEAQVAIIDISESALNGKTVTETIAERFDSNVNVGLGLTNTEKHAELIKEEFQNMKDRKPEDRKAVSVVMADKLNKSVKEPAPVAYLDIVNALYTMAAKGKNSFLGVAYSTDGINTLSALAQKLNEMMREGFMFKIVSGIKELGEWINSANKVAVSA